MILEMDKKPKHDDKLLGFIGMLSGTSMSIERYVSQSALLFIRDVDRLRVTSCEPL